MKTLTFNQLLLEKQVQNFIDKNLNTNIAKLIFKGSPFEKITIQEIVEQIEAKKKAESKLPTWFKTPNIYYPNKTNIEQCSSEITANYKANNLSGTSIIDISGGFGVDSYYFSKQFKEVTHCEINPSLSKLVDHNFKLLKTAQINTLSDDGIEYLAKTRKHFDWIYADPSRRNEIKGKVFMLKDCEPNIPENLELLLQYSNNILIKASPMLDISKALTELKFTKEVHVIAVDNEVKELLFVLENSYQKDILIKAINIQTGIIDSFESIYKNKVETNYALPKTYLYEPNAAILKAGLFNEVSHQLNIYKLHNNSHLYTNSKLINFPGRSFKINKIIPYTIKEIKKHIPLLKANVTVRNFPESVAQIRKKTKLKDGGSDYLFFTTDIHNKHIILVCQKV
ncbi:MAG: class I SAM-dependent methyltransferase [Aureibaculum sp.]